MASEITILGSNSAISMYDRFPSGQFIQIEQDCILVDCGEGTQFRMDQFHVKKSKINTILITHLHGDHVFGLPGLLTSFQLLRRKEALTIFGPRPLQEYLDINLGRTGHFIDYPLHIVEIDSEEVEEKGIVEILKLRHCVIETFELKHRIPCYGYRISELRKENRIDKNFIEKYNPSIREIKSIKQGEDFISKEGKVIKNENCIILSQEPKSYAYCSDTIFLPKLIKILKGTSTLYHESTYLDDLREKAISRYHSTAYQAGEMARGIGVERLILGHFSSKYKDLGVFKAEAERIFECVEIAKEGRVFVL